jgi:cobalt-zinc-cadmium efflux system protein
MSHSHSHQLKTYNRSFAIGISLNVIFVIIEASYGFIADSLALIADAGHNLSDVLSLLIAWGAALLASRYPTEKRTYGFRKITILASLTSAVLLLVALGSIAWEAIGRISSSRPVDGVIIITVAAIGVVINSLTALLFISDQKKDLNIKGAYFHMAADAGVSLGVVIAGVAIMFTGWLWLDPAISLAIVVVILIGTWNLLRDSINLSIDAIPKGIDVLGIKEYLTRIKNVINIHDLHIWPLSTTETALTVHLVVAKEPAHHFIREVQRCLHDDFGIVHATIQIETEDAKDGCLLNRPECI